MNRKPIFDAVRAMLGRGFTDGEVAALDRAITEAEGGGHGDPMPNLVPEEGFGAGSLQIGPQGVALVQRFEGCNLTGYRDPGTGGKPFTIGWGTTKIDGRDVRLGETITQAEADRLLVSDLARYAADVAKAIGTAPTTPAQFDALVSFHYNTGKIATATLTKKHVAGDYTGAKAEFGKWVNAGGKPLKGLIRRRAAEAELYGS